MQAMQHDVDQLIISQLRECYLFSIPFPLQDHIPPLFLLYPIIIARKVGNALKLCVYTHTQIHRYTYIP